MADDSGAIGMMLREIEQTYNTQELRAAYRAGMSTAAAICDEKAALVEHQHPGRKKGTVSPTGMFGSTVAKGCGHAIWNARGKIGVRGGTDG